MVLRTGYCAIYKFAFTFFYSKQVICMYMHTSICEHLSDREYRNLCIPGTAIQTKTKTMRFKQESDLMGQLSLTSEALSFLGPQHTKLYCINQNKFAYTVSSKLLSRDYKTLKIIRILFMSTIQTRNKMDDKIHQNQFYFVANAQLFDSSESNEISPMSNTAVNIAAAFHIFTQITTILAHGHR